jgi:protein O-GlcNAc transferase
MDTSRPVSPGVQEMFAAALRLHQAGRLNEAEVLYRQLLRIDPHHADTLHFLGVMAHQLGRNDAAVDLITKAIAENGRAPVFHNNLGNALQALGKLTEAAASYGWALSHKPDYLAAHYNLGVTLHAQGKFEEAAASYGRALVLKPDYAEAHINLGNTLQAQGRLEDAVTSYERALKYKPGNADAYNNLGNVRKAQGRLEEAVACYGRALLHKRDYAEAHNNLGLVLLEQGKLDEAAASCKRALLHKADFADAHTNLGHALRELGRMNEAVASYERALALKPDHADARLGLAIAPIPLFADGIPETLDVSERFARSIDELAAWNGADPGRLGRSVGSQQPFYLAYRPWDVTAQLRRYGELMCAAAAEHWQREILKSPADQGPRDRIRMVVVSGQVRQHPVWDVILRGLIAHMDRRRFEIILYHTASITDEETAWAKTRVDRFVQGPKPMRSWLEEIAQDRPDVLFYPEVGMDPATCALAALRLASLQVAGWGHPVTTGLPCMDLFVSGELLEEPGAERHYSERLIRLPGTGVCTELNAVEARRWEGPARLTNIVRFALCQQPIKFDPADDGMLARIAKAAGPCEFWLASPSKLYWAAAKLRERLARAFSAEGLDPDVYLRVMPWLPHNQFIGFLDEMDIYLDCPAFSGYTTAWQAIHRGLPIVTLEGEFLRQRLAAALLRKIGVTEGVALSREQYVEIAVGWAQERRHSDRWASRRDAIRRAASTADGNREAISAFEQTLTDAIHGRKA